MLKFLYIHYIHKLEIEFGFSYTYTCINTNNSKSMKIKSNLLRRICLEKKPRGDWGLYQQQWRILDARCNICEIAMAAFGIGSWGVKSVCPLKGTYVYSFWSLGNINRPLGSQASYTTPSHSFEAFLGAMTCLIAPRSCAFIAA